MGSTLNAAIWHLSRALNIGRVTAFVGSGLPMAYGRITWKGLVEAVAGRVETDCWKIIDPERLKRLGIDARSPALQKMTDLRQRILDMRQERVGTDQYPTLFQLAELLAGEIRKQPKSVIDELKLASETLHKGLATSIFDDRGQARELFYSAFPIGKNNLENSALEKPLSEFLKEAFGDDSGEFNIARTAIDSDRAVQAGKHYLYRDVFTRRQLQELGALWRFT